MRLIAIYNVWGDSLELLEGSIRSIRNVVDCVLIVAQEESNKGEIDRSVYPFCNNLIDKGLANKVIPFMPNGNSAYRNERNKRQIGIEYAKDRGYSHFIHMDSDEYYIESEFTKAKELIEKNQIKGSFIDLWTYYKEPTLRLSKKEDYSVPFIHAVLKNSNCGIHNRDNYEKAVDPTRAISIPSVFLSGIHMHHFSYIRKDLAKKIRNSTAPIKNKLNDIMEEYEKAHDGYHLRVLFDDHLIKVENQFNINIHETIQA